MEHIAIAGIAEVTSGTTLATKIHIAKEANGWDGCVHFVSIDALCSNSGETVVVVPHGGCLGSIAISTR